MLEESFGLELNLVGGMVDVTVGESVGDWLGGFILGLSGADGPGLLAPDPAEEAAVLAFDGEELFTLLVPPFFVP